MNEICGNIANNKYIYIYISQLKGKLIEKLNNYLNYFHNEHESIEN